MRPLEVYCQRPADNVVIADLLPVGLEVETPRLNSNDKAGLKLPRAQVTPTHLEIRDERLVLVYEHLNGCATNLPDDAHHYYYVANAVTPGEFIYPAGHRGVHVRPGRAGGVQGGAGQSGAKTLRDQVVRHVKGTLAQVPPPRTTPGGGARPPPGTPPLAGLCHRRGRAGGAGRRRASLAHGHGPLPGGGSLGRTASVCTLRPIRKGRCMVSQRPFSWLPLSPTSPSCWT